MNNKNSYTVAHISTGKTFRGGERQTLLLHQGLLSRGIRSFLLYTVMDDLDAKDIREAGKIPIRFLADFIGFIRFIFLMRKIDPAIIHCHDSYAFTFGSIASFMLHKKIIVTRRVIFPIRPSWFNRWKFGRCDHIIAVSSAVYPLCKAIANNRPVSIIHDGITLEPSKYSRLESRSLLKLNENHFVIGTVGYFTSEKNMPLVFQLASALKEEFPEVLIVCIGHLTESARKKIKEFSTIIETGILVNAAQYYNAFDLYISTATKEGLGTALLDAVVRDIPAVALHSGGSADIFPKHCPLHIESGHPEGFIAAVKNAITHYPDMVSYVKNLGKKAREKFALETMISKYIDVYKTMT